VIGLELSEEFCSRAARNIEAARPKLACQDVRCIVGDATTYELPGDVSHIFFNNPFWGDVLESVLGKIRESLDRSPRSVTLICDMPLGSVFEKQIRDVDWLSLEKELSLPSGRKALIFSA
jgi:hypothetical protein